MAPGIDSLVAQVLVGSVIGPCFGPLEIPRSRRTHTTSAFADISSQNQREFSTRPIPGRRVGMAQVVPQPADREQGQQAPNRQDDPRSQFATRLWNRSTTHPRRRGSAPPAQGTDSHGHSSHTDIA